MVSWHVVARAVSHLRIHRVYDGIIEEFHHHKLLQGHQVFLVGLIDTLWGKGQQYLRDITIRFQQGN